MIKKAKETDIGEIMEMYAHSRNIMRSNGNESQWINGYPTKEALEKDISQGQSYLIEEDGENVGTFAFIVGKDPTYSTIDGGHWLNDDKTYGTIHRLACKPDRHGIAQKCFEWCQQQTESLRIDTHADNTIVQKILKKNNFCYCGIIYVADGSPRKAYQKMTYPMVNASLRQYVEKEIVPRHDSFDSAHSRDHILTVIANSMEYSVPYDVDKNMVYTIAAYHDTGVVEGREHHHTVSGRIIREDTNLRQWFREDEIETIAEAAEDHRASTGKEPRSIYGKIVAEADRDIDKSTIITRTLQYGMSHYPEMSKEALWDRAKRHLAEKYGEEGYITLWLKAPRNVEALKELRALIADEQELRKHFEKSYDLLADERSK